MTNNAYITPAPF